MLRLPNHDRVDVRARYLGDGSIVMQIEFVIDGGDMTQSLSIKLDSFAAVMLHHSLGQAIVDMTICEAEAFFKAKREQAARRGEV